MSLLVITTNNNITIRKGKDIIMVNIEKSPELYKDIVSRMETDAIEAEKYINENFIKIKDQIEAKTNGILSVKSGVMVLKGTNIPVPETVAKKLRELENAKEDILPLMRFWKKLSLNPSENSRKDLYDFMVKNNIPITENGDIVTEKGVNQVKGSYFGHLVDVHSKTVDNSIGMHVTMDRSKVNADSNQTCSYGLHVGAPDYVRKNWTADVIVECIVDPKDVVSVPKDYNATKMRVCAYYVAGYGKSEQRAGNKVVSLNDFLQEPIAEVKQVMENQVKVEEKQEVGVNKETVISVKSDQVVTREILEGMTAKAIVEYIFKETGIQIVIDLKSKKMIVKKAMEILTEKEKPVDNLQEEIAEIVKTNEEIEIPEEIEKAPIEIVKEVVLSTMGRSELIAFAKEKFNETFSFFQGKETIRKKVTELATRAGYKVS